MEITEGFEDNKDNHSDHSKFQLTYLLTLTNTAKPNQTHMILNKKKKVTPTRRTSTKNDAISINSLYSYCNLSQTRLFCHHSWGQSWKQIANYAKLFPKRLHVKASAIIGLWTECSFNLRSHL
jgi:hypothetical protein